MITILEIETLNFADKYTIIWIHSGLTSAKCI